MLKNISRLESIIEGKVYHLLCDNDSPLLHVKEALCQFLKYCGNIEDQIKAQQEAAKAEEAAEQAKIEAETPPEVVD